jgi:CheY-like chemotaxis protein
MPESVFKIVLADSFVENRRILEQALCCCPSFELVQRIPSIAELVSYLAGGGNFVDKDQFPQPDLVLLDLNLSGRRSAFEVLKWVQAQPTRLYRIVIFSAQANDLECEEAYSLGADGFVSKPGSVAEMVVALTRIEGWLKSSILEDAEEFCVA